MSRLIGVYSMHDSAVNEYNPPMYARTDAEAERNVLTALSEENSQLAKHPQDFNLYRLAIVDLADGSVTPEDAPKLIFASARMVSIVRLNSHIEEDA